MSASERANSIPHHASAALAEADRVMTVCNSCRHCEGLCPVFPAMERRHVFSDADLNYLANLCHACGACYYDCQFSPPHEFRVHVPAALAQVRTESYTRYVWPRAFAPVFERNGGFVALALAVAVAAFMIGFAAWTDSATLFGVHTGPGAFYRLMPHNTMVTIFGIVFLYALLAIVMGVRAFWRDIGEAGSSPPARAALWQAIYRLASQVC
jgi:citrate/tricarballylate utilization protein